MTAEPLQITDEAIEKQKKAAATMRGVAAAAQDLLRREDELVSTLKRVREQKERLHA